MFFNVHQILPSKHFCNLLICIQDLDGKAYRSIMNKIR